MTIISRNLRKLRERNTAFSQIEMAKLLDVQQSTYCNWESGKSDVKSEYLPKIAEILKTEIQDLFQGELSKTEISKNITDNKCHSINGLIFVVTDKESVEKFVEIFKDKFTQN